MTTRTIIASVLALIVSLTTQIQIDTSRSILPAWYPANGHHMQLLAPYNLPDGPFAAGHRGIDVAHKTGAPVYSPADGVILFAGLVVDREVISIAVSPDLVLSIEPISTELQEGDAVTSNMELGTASSGGHCRSECIHIGVREHGEYVNPLRWFRSPPQLLPSTDHKSS